MKPTKARDEKELSDAGDKHTDFIKESQESDNGGNSARFSKGRG
jgi:hypothetical protein